MPNALDAFLGDALGLVPAEWTDHRAMIETMEATYAVKPVATWEAVFMLQNRGLVEKRLGRAEDGSLTYQVRRAGGVAT